MIDRLMEELCMLVNKKDEFVQKIMFAETESVPPGSAKQEMCFRSEELDASRTDFQRGPQQPLSASRRFISWLRS
jgi:hypothetical protein